MSSEEKIVSLKLKSRFAKTSLALKKNLQRRKNASKIKRERTENINI